MKKLCPSRPKLEIEGVVEADVGVQDAANQSGESRSTHLLKTLSEHPIMEGEYPSLGLGPLQAVGHPHKVSMQRKKAKWQRNRLIWPQQWKSWIW